MSTDIILFNGVNKLGFDNTLTIEIVKKPIRGKLNVVEGKDFAYNRNLVENKLIDIILSPEKEVIKDAMHHRNSGLNQVVCKFAKNNNIAIGFSLNEILKSKHRKALIGRMIQNVKLCRKYKVKMVFGSFANNKWQLRSKADMLSFAKVIGMNDKEAKESLTNIENILKRKKENWVRKGVRVLE
jgi:RNase P/RNase MRP subunit p30